MSCMSCSHVWLDCTYNFPDCCQGNRAHYDLGLAKEMQLTQSRGDFLVLHLSELVRVAFMAATSESDPLRLEGLKTLEVRELLFFDRLHRLARKSGLLRVDSLSSGSALLS